MIFAKRLVKRYSAGDATRGQLPSLPCICLVISVNGCQRVRPRLCCRPICRGVGPLLYVYAKDEGRRQRSRMTLPYASRISFADFQAVNRCGRRAADGFELAVDDATRVRLDFAKKNATCLIV